jgi:hypothetical protein
MNAGMTYPYNENETSYFAPQSTCSKTTWRFCDRSTRESPLKTESYSLTSAKGAVKEY